MLEAMDRFYETSYANVHRGVYELAERATEALEHARARMQAFLNAPHAREVIFVRNATEGLNLVAYAWGLWNLEPGDLVVVTELEHHSNFVPWQFIAAKRSAELRLLPLDEHGELDLSGLDALAREGPVKVVATNLVSNSLGTINPVDRLVAWAHEQGAIFVCDAAQAAPHMKLDVRALGADFVAVSGHKMCGPSGAGALWGRTELLQTMDPFLTGGHMINSVRADKTTWGELPHKFEAGTAPMAEAVGLGAAIDYLEALGMDDVREHEIQLTTYAMRALAERHGDALRIFGPTDPAARGGVLSFALEGVHPHDVSQVLDQHGVCVRPGHHCAKPLMRCLGVPATARASFYVYNDEADVDALNEALEEARSLFGDVI
jgi:cysteine desulfurase/selenocysteine lyase